MFHSVAIIIAVLHNRHQVTEQKAAINLVR